MSAQIISFSDVAKSKQSTTSTHDLNALITAAAKNLRAEKQKLPEGVCVISLPKSKDYFIANLQATIIKQHHISTAAALCAMYIGELLYKNISHIPASPYAIDYLINGQEDKTGRLLCDGGDLCFMYCTIFNRRCHWRQMSEKNYCAIGQGLYQAGYGKTGRDIHYYMSENFELMASITKETFLPI
ncbi:MAG: hypothetical protein WCG01_03210 [bacterium]